MRVIFAIPALTGEIAIPCMTSLMTAQKLLDLKGIEHEVYSISNCPAASVVRNSLVAMFMAEPKNTDLFFIDVDEKFDPRAVLKLLEREEEIVVGLYPLKTDELEFPVQMVTRDGSVVGKVIGENLALLEARLVPTGFMRVKRSVFEKMATHYPGLKYEKNVIRGNGESLDEAYDFFGMGIYGRQFRTEDYAFSQRWRDMGGQLWVYPNVDFEHIGKKAYKGNYHEYLMRLPGGAKSEAVNANAGNNS